MARLRLPFSPVPSLSALPHSGEVPPVGLTNPALLDRQGVAPPLALPIVAPVEFAIESARFDLWIATTAALLGNILAHPPRFPMPYATGNSAGPAVMAVIRITGFG